MAAASQLPIDVMSDILSRLPVKSLIRFKSVQKSWLLLIESPSFIFNHSRRAVSRADSRFLLINRSLEDDDTKLLTLLPNNAMGNLTNISLPPLFEDSSPANLIPGCVNGVVCLHNSDGSTIVLWNPAIKDYWELPKNPIRVPKNLVCENKVVNACVGGLGFGYDAKADDYKVIRITDFCITNFSTYSSEPYASVADLYSLKKNVWRRLDAIMEGKACPISMNGVLLNGIYHWVATYEFHNCVHPTKLFIMRFDISEERFCKSELSDFLNSEHVSFKVLQLTLLNNSIAAFVFQNWITLEDTPVEIWVMNEYDSKESWEKKYTIGPALALRNNHYPGFRNHRPIGFWNNEVVFRSQSDGVLRMYDLESEEINNDLDVNAGLGPIEVLSYTESLVSVSGKGGDYHC